MSWQVFWRTNIFILFPLLCMKETIRPGWSSVRIFFFVIRRKFVKATCITILSLTIRLRPAWGYPGGATSFTFWAFLHSFILSHSFSTVHSCRFWRNKNSSCLYVWHLASARKLRLNPSPWARPQTPARVRRCGFVCPLVVEPDLQISVSVPKAKFRHGNYLLHSLAPLNHHLNY